MAAAAVVVLSACSGPSDPPRPSSTAAAIPAASASFAATREALQLVLSAARSGDRVVFERQLSNRDPVFDDRARQLFDNLSGLPLTQLDARLLTDRVSLSDERRQLLGPDAWAQAAVVSWRLIGDTAPAEHRVWFTFAPDGTEVRLAGLIDRPPGAVDRQPSWWLGPVAGGRRGPVTVVVGAGQTLGTWQTYADRALTEVRRRLPSSTGVRQDRSLVVEVPATTADFERVVGAPSGTYTQVAAVTVAEGDQPQAALRVVVNPDAARRLTADGLGVTLTHEVVHLVTGSPRSPAPTWAVEGLADWVALQAYPKAAPAVAEPLLDQVRRSGAPAALPGDAAFATDARRLDLAYAQAWFICRYVATSASPADLGRLYRDLDRGRSVDQAGRDVLGSSAAELTAGWRRYLRAEARR